MGKISPNGEKTTVTFDIAELIPQKAYMKFPDKNLYWVDYIGNMFTRAAWRMIHLQTPHLMKEYKTVKVEGKGTVTVTFSEGEIDED